MKVTGSILGPFGWISQQPDGSIQSRPTDSAPGLYEVFAFELADAPVPAPPSPLVSVYHVGMDPFTWFLSVVAGKPFGQQTLLDVEPVLNASGWLITPANHEVPPMRTKVKPPDYAHYFRVGFGEGHWVWLEQS